ncbi:succinylglutamate desuccinylase/aspartoacylase family protein [Oceanibium sediminis]|uniref:succinylglutamate desuccinylase/aspartoacylase family protein n=1 Tax=Oceanibium sediminis TaxID=2026339 RepID=UPI000DD4ACE4|nr:succinylglutamate desuccinylase/aspartoacylase family protein [Oceanibium sediminis]
MVDAVSRIAADIDFEQQGRQSGYLRAPLSRNTSGWGIVEIPIVVVKNGSGPTVLFTGGIHGDEYEGPIAVSELARTLDPGAVQGRVILMPAVNIPAVLNDTRLSPVDDRDMNRCFPGNPKGTFSEMLAHYLDAVILPMVDASVDLHTAGHSGDSIPSTNMHHIADPDGMARTLAAAEAFGAPFNVVFAGVDEGATLTSSVERRRILSLGTELGGWGRVNIEGVRIARRGLRRFLHFMEVAEAPPADDDQRTRHMQVGDRAHYSFAPQAGTFEPCNMVGQTVRAGDPAGFLHFVEDVDRDPIEVSYKRDGILWMSAGPGRVGRGDTVAVVMNDYDGGKV